MFRTILRPRALRPLLLGFCVVLLDCATLDKLPESSCGNGVVNTPAEDCDTFPDDPKDTTHARCGAPSEGEFACHLRCGDQPNGTTLACPDGWGCSVSGICREPTGNFKPPLGAVSGGANQLAVGDFDGDGRRDLIGFGLRNTATNASRLRVHFFDDSGLLTNVAVLPGQSVSPAVFDHDHDGRDDIAFGVAVPGSNGVLGVVRGLADKTFLPVVFASASLPDTEAVPGFVYPRPGTQLPTNDVNAVLALARSAPSGAALISLQADFSGTERLTLPLAVGPEAVRGPMAWAMMFPGNAASTCGELVVAMQPSEANAKAALYVLSPCTVRPLAKTPTSKWASDAATAIKVFPLDTTLASDSRGALIADVDDDGHLDVLIDTVDGPYVAYGDPAGTTLLTPRRWAPTGVAVPPALASMPLAAGDLDLDGKTDFVFPTFVAVRNVPAAGDTVADAGADGGEGGVDAGTDGGTTGNRDGRLYARLPFQLWTDAVIGNFNADPYPDVILARRNSPDLVALLGGPDRVDGPTTTTITTNGRVEAIAKGDFDGDHIDDLAIAESTSVSGTSDLSIAYGRPFGALDTPARIGSVDTPKGVASVLNGSAPADLGLFAYAKTLNGSAMYHTTSLTLLKGSGDRQPVAPLLFIEPLSCSRMTMDACNPSRPAAAGARFWNPVGVAAGHFASPDDSAVLSYAVGTPGGKPPTIPIGAWVADVDPTAPGGLKAPVERQVLDKTVEVVDSGGTVRLATATGVLDPGDKARLEKIVAITNVPDSLNALLLVVDPTAKPPSVTPTVLPGLRVEVGAQLSLVDVDGDGFLDAVGSFSEASVPQVYVFLNTNGKFTAPGIKVTYTAGDPATAGIGNTVAFAPINLHGAPATGGVAQTKGLALLTEHSLALVSLRPDKKSFDSTTLGPLLGKDFGMTTGIAAGDFNGDGVDDIAIAVDGAIRILLQTPARAPK